MINTIYDYPVMLFACFLALVLSLAMMYQARATFKRNERRYRDEQRELLKWQMDLEKRASELQSKKH